MRPYLLNVSELLEVLTDLLSFSREVVLEALAWAEEEVIPPEEEALMAMLDCQNNQALSYHLVP